MADALKARRSCGGQLDRLRFRIAYVPFTRSPHIPAAVNVGLGVSLRKARNEHIFRNAPDSCRKRTVPALTFSAISGHSSNNSSVVIRGSIRFALRRREAEG